jgi:hypothetical protein
MSAQDVPETKCSGALVGAIVGIMLLAALLDFATYAAFGSILFTFPLALCARQRSKWVLWGTAAGTVIPTLTAARHSIPVWPPRFEHFLTPSSPRTRYLREAACPLIGATEGDSIVVV